MHVTPTPVDNLTPAERAAAEAIGKRASTGGAWGVYIKMWATGEWCDNASSRWETEALARAEAHRLAVALNVRTGIGDWTEA